MAHRTHSISLLISVALGGLVACGSEPPATEQNPVGMAGTVATPMAGQGGAKATGTAGSSTGSAGTGTTATAGSTATGRAGAPATTTAGAGAAGVAAAAAGSSGSAAAGSGNVAAGSGGMTAATGTTAAASGSGGTAATSGGAGGSSAGPAGGNGGNVMPGMGGAINATQIVGAGQVFDGGGKRYTAGRALGDGSQSEGQQPMFRVESGGTLKNVVLGAPAADGIHTYGNATLENIVWEDIGEDAMTIKEEGTVTLNGGSAMRGDDKVFQINAPSTFKVSNFTARDAGKFIRQNGDTTFKVAVEIDKCDISRMDESIFRTDSRTSTVKMTNTRYSMIGDELFMGVSPGNITESGNMQY